MFHSTPTHTWNFSQRFLVRCSLINFKHRYSCFSCAESERVRICLVSVVKENVSSFTIDQYFISHHFFLQVRKIYSAFLSLPHLFLTTQILCLFPLTAVVTVTVIFCVIFLSVRLFAFFWNLGSINFCRVFLSTICFQVSRNLYILYPKFLFLKYCSAPHIFSS